MINIAKQDKDFIIKHVQNADIFFANDDIAGLIDVLYERIAFGEDTFTANHDITDFGRQLERIYDKLIDLKSE